MSSFGTKSILLRHNIASHPKKFTAISFRTSAQESARKCSSNFSSNYYTPIFKLLWKKQHLKTSTPRAIFAKNTLFSAETYRKTHFSAGYSNFFALFVAEILKSCITMIIGRENEQRELCKLHGSSMLIRPRV